MTRLKPSNTFGVTSMSAVMRNRLYKPDEWQYPRSECIRSIWIVLFNGLPRYEQRFISLPWEDLR